MRELLAVVLCSGSSGRAVVSASSSLIQVRECGCWVEHPLCRFAAADEGHGSLPGVEVKAGGGWGVTVTLVAGGRDVGLLGMDARSNAWR